MAFRTVIPAADGVPPHERTAFGEDNSARRPATADGGALSATGRSPAQPSLLVRRSPSPSSPSGRGSSRLPHSKPSQRMAPRGASPGAPGTPYSGRYTSKRPSALSPSPSLTASVCDGPAPTSPTGSLPPSPGMGQAWPFNSTDVRLESMVSPVVQPPLEDEASPTSMLRSTAARRSTWTPVFTQSVARGGLKVPRTPTFGVGPRFPDRPKTSSRAKGRRKASGGRSKPDADDGEQLLYLPPMLGRQPQSPNRSSPPPVFGTSTRDHWQHVELALPPGARRPQSPDRHIGVGPGQYSPPSTLGGKKLVSEWRSASGVALRGSSPKVWAHAEARRTAARSPGPVYDVAGRSSSGGGSGSKRAAGFGYGPRSPTTNVSPSPGPTYSPTMYMGKGRSAGFGFGARFK